MKSSYLMLFAFGVVCALMVSCTTTEDTRVLPCLAFPVEPQYPCQLLQPKELAPCLPESGVTEEYKAKLAEWSKKSEERQKCHQEYVKQWEYYVKECKSYPARNAEYQRQWQEKNQ